MESYGGGMRRRNFLLGPAVMLLVLVVGIGSASAFKIDTGSPDWTMRWDNTIRYTMAYRVQDRDRAILENPNADDGDRNFSPGIVSNRIDVLSEFDVAYKKYYGVRISGAVWYDERYSEPFDSKSLATSNVFRGGQQIIGLGDFADRYFNGPYGELLDAFVFGRVRLGDVPLYVKAGRHTLYWGEALLTPFHGISYGQMPLDLGKATASPGVEAKEFFRPLNNVSFLLQPSTEFTIAAQYFMEWDKDLTPEPGTYFGSSDLSLMDRDTVLILAPGVFATHGRDLTPNEFHDFGVNAKYSPKGFGGGNHTFGLYYRHFSDKLPQAIINTTDLTYHFAYAGDIDLVGVSWATQIFGLSLGSEISYRHDMPLTSDAVLITSPSQLPRDGSGDVLGARGDTMHAVVNLIGLLRKTSLWDAGSWNAEMVYSRWLDVTQGEQYFTGRDTYHGFNKATRDSGAIAANFSPQYLQVLSGLDVTLPITAGIGMWGVSPVAAGGGMGDGNWGVGIAFDYLTKYKLSINYVDYFGPISDSGLTRGGSALIRDRDVVTITFKTSF